MRHAILPAVLLALLGACGDREPDPTLTPDELACRRQAERSPALAQLDHLYIPNNYGRQAQIERARQQIIERAERDCLRDHGLSSRTGGVERQRR